MESLFAYLARSVVTKDSIFKSFLSHLWEEGGANFHIFETDVQL